MKNKIVDCQKAGSICDKCQYQEAGMLERFLLKVHVLTCKSCKQHTVKNSKLTGLVKEAELKCCAKETKERLSREIEQELNKK